MTGDAVPSLNAPLPVVTATITAGSVRAEFMLSTQAALHDQTIVASMIVPSGPYLDMGRNKCVAYFLNEDQFAAAEYLLFVDSDIAYTPEDVRRLVEATAAYHDEHGVWPLTGGVYQGVVGGEHICIAYHWSEPDENGSKVFDPIQVETIRDIPQADATLMPCDAFGTGFMLIHRDMLTDFPEHFDSPQQWFAEIPVDGTWFGEDLIFCMRAASLGYPVLLHPGVRLTHYKDIGLVF